MIESVGIFGVGGVGGYFGGKLCRIKDGADAFRISFLARGAHLRAIQKNGLLLKTEKNDERDLFAGALIKLAAELELEAPATTAIFAKLEAIKPISSRAIISGG